MQVPQIVHSVVFNEGLRVLKGEIMDKWYSLYLKLQLWLENDCFTYRSEGDFRHKLEEHAKQIPNYSHIDVMLAVDQIMFDKFGNKEGE